MNTRGAYTPIVAMSITYISRSCCIYKGVFHRRTTSRRRQCRENSTTVLFFLYFILPIAKLLLPFFFIRCVYVREFKLIKSSGSKLLIGEVGKKNTHTHTVACVACKGILIDKNKIKASLNFIIQQKKKPVVVCISEK